jgi:hypothetical protein
MKAKAISLRLVILSVLGSSTTVVDVEQSNKASRYYSLSLTFTT